MSGPRTPGAAAAAPRRTAEIELRWVGGQRFGARGKAGVEIPLDGDSVAAPSPVEALLAALASCAAADVVEILRKGRQDLTALHVTFRGDRREEHPRRFTRIEGEFRIAGAVERAKAERAVRLAVEKYCSVRASLDPAIPVEWRVVLEG
ncbi:MAG TPA: OsmC family protein [Gemmatimonadota bacterium]